MRPGTTQVTVEQSNGRAGQGWAGQVVSRASPESLHLPEGVLV